MVNKKLQIRQQMLAKRTFLQGPQRDNAERRIHQQLLTYIQSLEGKEIIAGYYPANGEVNILQPLQDIVSKYSLALPSVVNNNSPLQFNQWDGDEASLTPGKYNIPTATGPIVEPAIILVPLVTATDAGQRLGYGGGYYDRTIAKYPNATTIGIAFAFQILPELPVEPHDQPLDAIITEQGMIPITS